MSDKNTEMVESQIASRGVRDERVIEAMKDIDRKDFIDAQYSSLAYSDRPVPIGNDQTISQPYIVGYMTEKLDIKEDSRALEIGAGCGYQTAILCKIANYVYGIDIEEELVKKAKNNLKNYDFDNYKIKTGNGRQGWEEHAPFDRIIIAAASNDIPPKLIEQLKIGGKMLLPFGGSFSQTLTLVEKTKQGIEKRKLLSVRFVPLVDGD